MPSTGLQELDERSLFALLDMYDNAIADIGEPHDDRIEVFLARLERRRTEVVSALALLHRLHHAHR